MSLRGSKTHDLKILPEFFELVRKGKKTAVVAFDKHDFFIGDVLHLKEWTPRKKVFTGKSLHFVITDITRLHRLIPDIDHRWVVLHFGGLLE